MQKEKLLIFLFRASIIVLLMSVSNASATVPETIKSSNLYTGPYTIHEFLWITENGTPGQNNAINAYIRALIDSADYSTICYPEKETYQNIKDNVVNYVFDHPEMWAYAAYIPIKKGLIYYYSCKK